MADIATDIARLRESVEAIKKELAKVIVGQTETIDSMLVTILCRAHALLEGVPGTAKTLMVRTLARLTGAQFGRIQFTPDLMPSDILGTNVFNLQTNTFHLARGPIFADFLLADEINRTPAKTQSALLEAMEERRVTIDGVGHPLHESFTVFATQNPIEQEGTYPLPEAQLDRFLLKIQVGYPSPEEEDRILTAWHRGYDPSDLDRFKLKALASREELLRLRKVVGGVTVDAPVIRYIRTLVQTSRRFPQILLGGGPRAGIGLLLSAKALAAISGRDFATPDDVRRMAYPVLRHRLILSPDAEVEGTTADQVIQQLLASVEVPR
ncbi:MAG: MoxR family ATPase [Planctomycetes bacterium]|nr:MoxR family ATPase [Planctomycetota bacterium]